MNVLTKVTKQPKIEYPDCDGLPMAENTLQFRWITTLQGGIDGIFRDDPNVFVAGDLLWYPVEGNNKIRTAPDTLVVLGRPKGYRGSYRQWEEGNIAPQVVFEILSPGNRYADTVFKFQFYDRYGVEEYYAYDPDKQELNGWIRVLGELKEITDPLPWISPRLKIRFEMDEDGLVVYGPDGMRFASYVELVAQKEKERREKEMERQEKEMEKERADRLAAQLRALGIEPEG